MEDEWQHSKIGLCAQIKTSIKIGKNDYSSVSKKWALNL